jgi:hypothetical protein
MGSFMDYFKFKLLERKAEIEQDIFRSIASFGLDNSLSHQSMSLLGLMEMRRDIPRDEFLTVLKSIDGIILDLDNGQVSIPTHYFRDL